MTEVKELFPKNAGRHGQPGYFSLAELPQRESIASIARATGWWEFDRIFKFYPGQLVVVSGISGHGKSTFLFNLLHNAAKLHGTRTFMFIPENESYVREKMSKIHGGSPASFQEIAANYFYVQSAIPDWYGNAPITIDWVLSQAEKVVEKDHVDIVLIDPWNELEHAKRRDQTTTEYIGESLMVLKSFTRALAVTAIVVAHPTKAVFDAGKARVPGLADIEGSMNWYNKCDNGLIVSRDFSNNTAKVISAKVRELGAGKVGCCHFVVDEETGVFTPQYGAST